MLTSLRNTVFLGVLLLVSSSKIKTQSNLRGEEYIEIANYDYPKLKDEENSDSFIVPIVGTSDIHGFGIENESKKDFTYGGASYFATYLKALNSEFNNRVLWVDAGDQYQGGSETKMSDGQFMIDFMKKGGIKAATLGNHQFDYGKDFLLDKLGKLPYVDETVLDLKEDGKILRGIAKAKLYTFLPSGIKIAIIGLTTNETPSATGGDLSYTKFTLEKDMPDRIHNAAKIAREKGANAVVLIAHSGLDCQETEETLNPSAIGFFTKDSPEVQKCTGIGELSNVLNALNKNEDGIKDLDVAFVGHNHLNRHYYINGIPVLSPMSELKFFNVAYLTFKKSDKTLESVSMEGPVPVCSKVYKNELRCLEVDSVQKDQLGELVPFTFHGKVIEKDQEMGEVLEKYVQQTKELEEKKLFTLEGPEDGVYNRDSIRQSEGFLGNFVCSIVLDITKSDISFLNHGLFRTTWVPGTISLKSYIEMFPYDNYITTFNISPKELKTLIEEIEFRTAEEGGKGFYPFAGVHMTYDKENHILKDLTFDNGKEFDLTSDEKTIKIGTLTFLYPGYGDDFVRVKGKIEPENYIGWGDFKASVRDYLEGKTFKVSDYYDPSNPWLIEG